jgi:hypothetical protein
MKRILILAVICSLFFSCSNTSSEEKFELIQSVDSVFTLYNYYPKDSQNPNPGYVDISMSMKVYESNQTKTLSPDSIPFLKKDVELRKKKVELIIENWLFHEPFRDTIDVSYLLEEFERLIDDKDPIFLKNAEIIKSPEVFQNGDRNFVVAFFIGIPDTDRIYRCGYVCDVIGYGYIGGDKVEE